MTRFFLFWKEDFLCIYTKFRDKKVPQPRHQKTPPPSSKLLSIRMSRKNKHTMVLEFFSFCFADGAIPHYMQSSPRKETTSHSSQRHPFSKPTHTNNSVKATHSYPENKTVKTTIVPFPLFRIKLTKLELLVGRRLTPVEVTTDTHHKTTKHAQSTVIASWAPLSRPNWFYCPVEESVSRLKLL